MSIMELGALGDFVASFGVLSLCPRASSRMLRGGQ